MPTRTKMRIFRKILKPDSAGQLLVDNGAHDASDVVHNYKSHKCVKQTVRPSQIPAQPAADPVKVSCTVVQNSFIAVVPPYSFLIHGIVTPENVVPCSLDKSPAAGAGVNRNIATSDRDCAVGFRCGYGRRDTDCQRSRRPALRRSPQSCCLRKPCESRRWCCWGFPRQKASCAPG